jgi:anti-sigma B factor antagonist
MAAQSCTVRFHQDGVILRFQIEGWATMVQSVPFRRFVEKSLAGPTRRIHVDLRNCTYIDSTFLGTLLLFQKSTTRLQGGEFRLLAPSLQCSCLFKQMGVLDLFQIQNLDEPAVTAWTPLIREGEDQPALERNVLQAHQELANLPGKAGEPFRAVMKCLAKDLEGRDKE